MVEGTEPREKINENQTLIQNPELCTDSFQACSHDTDFWRGALPLSLTTKNLLTFFPKLDVSVNSFLAKRMSHKPGNLGHVVNNLKIKKKNYFSAFKNWMIRLTNFEATSDESGLKKCLLSFDSKNAVCWLK